jgi:hypothetical protein
VQSRKDPGVRQAACCPRRVPSPWQAGSGTHFHVLSGGEVLWI